MIAGTSCGGRKPFNVKRRVDLRLASDAARAVADSIGIQAQPLTDEDFLYETFDANLIAAGILPVRLMLTNSSTGSVNLKNTRFEVRSQTGRSFKSSKADEAFKRLVSYYGISTYNKSGYKESKNDFGGYALDTKPPLVGGQSRQGLLFFLMPAEIARETGLTLLIGRLGAKQTGGRIAVELRLN